MTGPGLETVLDQAVAALTRMAPDAIESAQHNLQNASREARPDASLIGKLRLARAAALQSAQLWHACVPQAGYSPEATTNGRVHESTLSVTG